MNKAIVGGCIAAACVGAVIYANSRPANFSDQFITLPSGYKAYCNEQGYREIRYHGRPELVTDDDGNFVECDASVGPPGTERTDEQRAEGARQRAEYARSERERAVHLQTERASARLNDRLAQCGLKTSSIFDWPDIHRGPIPENPDQWQRLQEKCRLQARAWYEQELETDPSKMPPRSSSLSFHTKRNWESISDVGLVLSHTMDGSGNLKYSYNESTGVFIYPSDQ